MALKWVWCGINQPVALLSVFDSNFQLFYIVGSDFHLGTIWLIVYGVQVRWVGCLVQHRSIMVSKPVTCSFDTVKRCQVPAWKENQHCHKVYWQKEAWSALKSPDRQPQWLRLDKIKLTNNSRWHDMTTLNYHWFGLQTNWSLSLWTLISRWNEIFNLFVPIWGKMLSTFLVQDWFDIRNATLVDHFLRLIPASDFSLWSS